MQPDAFTSCYSVSRLHPQGWPGLGCTHDFTSMLSYMDGLCASPMLPVRHACLPCPPPPCRVDLSSLLGIRAFSLDRLMEADPHFLQVSQAGRQGKHTTCTSDMWFRMVHKMYCRCIALISLLTS